MNGATLRAIRTTCGYTLNHFGSLVKVSGRTIATWELDARDVYADVALVAETLIEQYREIQDNVIPQLLATGDGVYAYRHDSPAPPHGFDRVLWNAAVSAWAALGGKELHWYGDEDEEGDQ